MLVYTEKKRFRLFVNFIVGFTIFAFIMPGVYNDMFKYDIKQPIQVGKFTDKLEESRTFKACDYISINYERTSTIDSRLDVIINVVPVNNGTHYEIREINGSTSVGTKSIISKDNLLPCNIDKGKYTLRVISTVYIFNTIPKKQIFNSVEFEII